MSRKHPRDQAPGRISGSDWNPFRRLLGGSYWTVALVCTGGGSHDRWQLTMARITRNRQLSAAKLTRKSAGGHAVIPFFREPDWFGTAEGGTRSRTSWEFLCPKCFPRPPRGSYPKVRDSRLLLEVAHATAMGEVARVAVTDVDVSALT